MGQWPCKWGTGKEGRTTKVLGRNESSWFEKQQKYGGEETVLLPEVEETKAGPSHSALNPAHREVIGRNHMGKKMTILNKKEFCFLLQSAFLKVMLACVSWLKAHGATINLNKNQRLAPDQARG